MFEATCHTNKRHATSATRPQRSPVDHDKASRRAAKPAARPAAGDRSRSHEPLAPTRATAARQPARLSQAQGVRAQRPPINPRPAHSRQKGRACREARAALSPRDGGRGEPASFQPRAYRDRDVGGGAGGRSVGGLVIVRRGPPGDRDQRHLARRADRGTQGVLWTPPRTRAPCRSLPVDPTSPPHT